MSLFALVLGPQERAVLAELVTRAAASPIDYATMKKIADAHASGAKGLGDLNRALTVEIPIGYTVTLTHEEHKPGLGIGERSPREGKARPAQRSVSQARGHKAAFTGSVGVFP